MYDSPVVFGQAQKSIGAMGHTYLHHNLANGGALWAQTDGISVCTMMIMLASAWKLWRPTPSQLYFQGGCDCLLEPSAAGRLVHRWQVLV